MLSCGGLKWGTARRGDGARESAYMSLSLSDRARRGEAVFPENPELDSDLPEARPGNCHSSALPPHRPETGTPRARPARDAIQQCHQVGRCHSQSGLLGDKENVAGRGTQGYKRQNNQWRMQDWNSRSAMAPPKSLTDNRSTSVFDRVKPVKSFFCQGAKCRPIENKAFTKSVGLP